MSKRTNSLLLRLGYSILWSNKKYLLQNSFILKLLYSLNRILLKKKYNLLKIFIINYHLKLYIYKSEMNLYKNRNIKNNFTFYVLLQNIFKKKLIYKLIIFLKFFKKVKHFNKNLIYDFKKTIFFLNLNNLKYKNYFKYKKKIKKKNIFSRLKLKYLCYIVELEVNKKFNKQFLLSIINIFSGKGFSLRIKKIKSVYKQFLYTKKWSKNYVKDSRNDLNMIYVIFLSNFYKLSSILALYLSSEIAFARKRQKKFLYSFIKIFKSCVDHGIISNKGFGLIVRGKINGFLRRSQFKYSMGILKLQVKDFKVSYFLAPSFTRYGVISVRLWIY